MKRFIFCLLTLFIAGAFLSATFSEESKTWEATDKAKKFVQETIVIGFFRQPLWSRVDRGQTFARLFGPFQGHWHHRPQHDIGCCWSYLGKLHG